MTNEYMWSLAHHHLYGTDMYVSKQRAVIECKALEIVKTNRGNFAPWDMSTEDMLLNWCKYTDGEEQLIIDRAPVLKMDCWQLLDESLRDEVCKAIDAAGWSIEKSVFPITADLEKDSRECCCSCAPSPEDLTGYLRGSVE